MKEIKTNSNFDIVRLVRDAQSTKNSQRELLYALAIRCDTSKNFVCWPSYAKLAEDTLLDEVTLKRAARKLEEANLIKRAIRSNRSNVFFLNVPLLVEQSKQAAQRRTELADKEDVDLNPFDRVNAETMDDDDNVWEVN